MRWFEIALVALTLVTGAIWLLDNLVFAKPQVRRGQARRREPVLVKYAKAVFPVLALVLCLRSFVGTPFRVASGSLLVADGQAQSVGKFVGSPPEE